MLDVVSLLSAHRTFPLVNLSPGSNFHYRMDLGPLQNCQPSYFARNLGVGALYFAARVFFSSRIMDRLGSATAFYSDQAVDSDHDQSETTQ